MIGFGGWKQVEEMKYMYVNMEIKTYHSLCRLAIATVLRKAKTYCTPALLVAISALVVPIC